MSRLETDRVFAQATVSWVALLCTASKVCSGTRTATRSYRRIRSAQWFLPSLVRIVEARTVTSLLNCLCAMSFTSRTA
jgi:hypothetical protein